MYGFSSRGWGVGLAWLLVLAPQARGLMAQSGEPDTAAIGVPAIGVSVPDSMANMNSAQLTELGIRLTDVIARSGLSGYAVGARFLLVPRLTVLREQTVEQMRVLTVLRARLTLSVTEGGVRTVFASHSLDLNGTGATREEALNALLDGVGADADLPALDAFFGKARRRILDYYETSCDAILADVRRSLAAQNYRNAFLEAMSVPREARTCHRRAIPLVEQTFRALDRENCMRELTHARSASAAGNVLEASEHIKRIDVTGTCAKEVDEFIAYLERRTNRLSKENKDFVVTLIGSKKQTEQKAAPKTPEEAAKKQEEERGRAWKVEMQDIREKNESLTVRRGKPAGSSSSA